MNIVHAGGKIKGNCYTNSKEAIEYHIKNNNNKIIEVDVVKIKDCYVIAHDYTEKSFYNYDGKFSDLEYREYKNLKVFKKYTPMDFYTLKEFIDMYPEIYFVLDIKNNGNEYKEALIYIKNLLKSNISNLIPQIYNYDDFQWCKEYGYNKCLFATYKIIFGKSKEIINSNKILNVIEKIDNNLHNIELIGISVHIDYYGDENFKKFNKKMKHKIYFHGQIETIEKNIINKLNNNGFGLFAHNIL